MPRKQKNLLNFGEILSCSLLKAFYLKLKRPGKQGWLPPDGEVWFLGHSVKTTHRVQVRSLKIQNAHWPPFDSQTNF